MELNSESLRFILGIKVKQYRQEKGLSLKELSAATSLSISYLSEIEKGKKYPKPEKIILLAQGLDKTFDDMVSLHIEDGDNPITALLNSPVFNEFPLHQFGITLTDVFDLVTNTPSKAGAFIRTLLEIGRNYDMQVEHFLLASLRSYQKMHMNYFKDIEEETRKFRMEFDAQLKEDISNPSLEAILSSTFQVKVEYKNLSKEPELGSLRSIWIKGEPDKLIINERLQPVQRLFILAKEVGYRVLKLEKRPTTSSWMQVESFDHVYNNFKSSYFAGALLLPEDQMVADLKIFFTNKDWDTNRFTDLLTSYNTTPEMFLHRLSQLLPHHFGMQRMHYLRLQNDRNSEQYQITKELNTTNIFVPRGIGGSEHHCRRWVSVNLLKDLKEQQKSGDNPGLIISTQRSHFMGSDKEFFNIAIARPLTLSDGVNSGMTLGFQLDKRLKNEIVFWNDTSIPKMHVNESCERCSLEDCESRVAPPLQLIEKERHRQKINSLDDYIESNKEP